MSKRTTPQILVMAFSHLEKDPRIQRQLQFLQNRGHITTVGISHPQIPGIGFIPCKGLSKSFYEKVCFGLRNLCRQFEESYWKLPVIQHCLTQLQHRQFDLIIANDIFTLPLALRIRNGAKVLYDAHEYAPREHEGKLSWRIFHQQLNSYLCKKYMPQADQTITVCTSIAEEYCRNTGVTPHIITNAPAWHNLEPIQSDPFRIRMVHHGGALPSRKIERMIDLFHYLDDRFEMDLILFPGSASYINKLQIRARKHPKIRFLPALPMSKVISTINTYDIGLYLLESNTFNEKYALPNKIFEFIQARLLTAIGPSPEMARLIQEHKCGIVSPNFSLKTLADKLKQLDSKKIMEYKFRSHIAAKELCAENNKNIFIHLVEQLLENR